MSGMTKYVTTPEEKYECYECGVSCARRELIKDMSCPNCGTNFMTFLNIDGEVTSVRLVVNRERQICSRVV